MKKLILLSIILMITSCDVLESDYTIEQDWFAGDFTTWVWYKRKIVQSYTIDKNSVTKSRIKSDSIKAANFIDCVKYGRNCTPDKIKERIKYRIEQGFLYGQFNTWIWINGELAMSYQINESKVSQSKITQDSLKAVKWIEKNKKFIKK